MVLFPVTLVTPNYPPTIPFSTFCIAIHILVVGEKRDFKFGGWVDCSKC